MGDDEKPEFQVVPALPEKLTDGRDELNFAEFPLGTIAERIDKKTKTIVFEDRIFDKSRNEMITRRLTITGSDAHGLPTSTDDEVLLGLVQLAKLQRFDSQKVYFSRYQLINLLKWPLNGQSYERITEAMKRWVGVTLYYEKAWRDRETNKWKDEDFHILERVQVYSDENERTRPKPHPKQGSFEFASSFFMWNEVVFKSFKSGNLKALDFDFVLGLRSAVTRRLYRFLDKRFFNVTDKRGLGGALEFDMKTLAYEHVGLSRNTPTGDLKRKLGAAMNELVERQFLKDLPLAQRFRKVKAGEWKVRFEKADPGASNASAGESTSEPAAATTTEPEIPASSLEARLVQHGVSRAKAAELVRAHPEALIAEKLEVLEALTAKNDKRVSSNPAGFLISSIEKRFSSPRDVETAAQREAREAAKAKRAQAAVEREKRKREQQEAKELEREQMIAKFWETLSPEMRGQAEAEAIANADRYQRELVERGGLAGQAARKSILNAYALSELAAG